jgi:hypothetical protein
MTFSVEKNRNDAERQSFTALTRNCSQNTSVIKTSIIKHSALFRFHRLTNGNPTLIDIEIQTIAIHSTNTIRIRSASSVFELLHLNLPRNTIFFTYLSNYISGPSGRAFWGVDLRSLACWDCGFESRRRHGCLSVVSVVCCQVEVSATIWSLVQRSPTDCDAS